MVRGSLVDVVVAVQALPVRNIHTTHPGEKRTCAKKTYIQSFFACGFKEYTAHARSTNGSPTAACLRIHDAGTLLLLLEAV